MSYWIYIVAAVFTPSPWDSYSPSAKGIRVFLDWFSGGDRSDLCLPASRQVVNTNVMAKRIAEQIKAPPPRHPGTGKRNDTANPGVTRPFYHRMGQWKKRTPARRRHRC